MGSAPANTGDRRLPRRHLPSREPLATALARFSLPVNNKCYVHIASEPTTDLTAFCSSARLAGALVSADFNGRDMNALSQELSVAFLNRGEWSKLVGARDLSWRLARELVIEGGKVIVTMGRDGAICLAEDKVTHCAASPAVEVDRTGGGDAFNAGFLTTWAEGGEIEESLRAGLTSAARIIGCRGARR